MTEEQTGNAIPATPGSSKEHGLRPQGQVKSNSSFLQGHLGQQGRNTNYEVEEPHHDIFS